jgi:hypothetical protein
MGLKAVFDLGLCVTEGVAVAGFNVALNKPCPHVHSTMDTTLVNPSDRYLIQNQQLFLHNITHNTQTKTRFSISTERASIIVLVFGIPIHSVWSS